MAPNPTHTPPKAIGYIRVSTGRQADSGLGLEAQEAQIRKEAAHRGWDLEIVVDAGASGKDTNRPGLERALKRLDRGDADILVAAKLDRITRSTVDGGALFERAKENGWSIVAIDADLNTTTAMGEAMAKIILVMAELERNLIRERTKAALAAKAARGEHIGGTTKYDDAILRRILEERRSGASMGAIARSLEAGRVPTTKPGAHWHASTVRAVLLSERASELGAGE